VCRNEISGEEFRVRAKCVINATGPFTDAIRYANKIKYGTGICQTLFQCRGSALVSTMRIRIQLFMSLWIRIRIKEAKPLQAEIRIRLLIQKKLNFYMKYILKVPLSKRPKNIPTKVPY
jgi:hypothetical protein